VHRYLNHVKKIEIESQKQCNFTLIHGNLFCNSLCIKKEGTICEKARAVYCEETDKD